MENPDSDIPALLMPIVSDNWAKYITWEGTVELPAPEKQKLADMAAKAKNKGYILRF